MKDMLLNTFNPQLTILISLMLMMGSLTWTSKMVTKPSLLPKPSLKLNKFL